MAVTVIELLAKLISTAKAAYADIDFNALENSLVSKTVGADFAATEASSFVGDFNFLNQQQNTNTGFSAVLFSSTSGKKVLAIRGTEIPADIINDLFSADFGDIGGKGYAAKQACDLYRYWKQLTSDVGQKNIYSEEELETLYALKNGSLDDGLDGVSHEIVFQLFKSNLNDDEGLGLVGKNEAVDVTGHSLGGHLAYLFGRFFPENTGQIATLNAPGLFSWGDSLLNDLGFAIQGGSITSVIADGDTVNKLGNIHPGKDIYISQEAGSTLVVDGLTYNHSSVNGVDSLNLLNLFSQLDTSKANEPSGILNNFMRLSANKALDTYENMLDGLRNMLLGANIERTPPGTKADLFQREKFYQHIRELQESSVFNYLKGKVSFVSAATNINSAKNNYGQFLALYYATPFSLEGNSSLLSGLNPDLYAAWSADQNLSAEDRKNGKANFSDEWYQDSAVYLQMLMGRNKNDIDKLESSDPNGKDGFYIKVVNDDNDAHHIFSGSTNASNYSQDPAAPRIILGTLDDNDNATRGGDGNDRIYGLGGDDKLNGLKGNDQLYAGTGSDELNGGEGHDVLLGGEGTDTYIFEGNFGTDVIKDSDGSGSISIAGWSGGFTSVQGSDIIFRDASKKFEAIKINNGSSTDLLITSLNDATTGNVLIKNWTTEKSLGVSLTVNTTTVPNTGAGTVNGTVGNNAITLDNLRDSNPNLDISTFSALNADGKEGNDIIMGMLQGSDTLLGGAGDDIISGGFTSTLGADASKNFQSVAAVPGADKIDGGAGKDFIFASAGGSIAHGGTDDDVLLSTGPAYFQFNNLNEVLKYEGGGIAGHRAITRDEVYADALTHMDFGVEKNGLVYQLSSSFFQNFTSSFAEYNSAIENVKFIGKKGNAASNHSNGDVSYGFTGNYTLTYDYSNDGQLTPLTTGNPSPASMAVSTFAPGAGKTLDDFANVKGANLFGDEGNDYLGGGIYADYLSGGADKDTIFAGAGNDVIDGGEGNDELYGEEGKDIIVGGLGDDTLFGGDGDDVLVGGEGRDSFSGENGINIIVGDVTDQYFASGTGNSIFIIEDIVFEETDLSAASNRSSDTLGYASLSSSNNPQAASANAQLLTIDSSDGNNTLALVGVSSLDQINLTAQNNDLILRTGNAAIFIRDGLGGTVDHLALGDSADEFTDSATSAKSTTIDEVMLARLSTEVTRTAQTAGAQLAGGLLNDTLTAHAGGSILIGGQSDDTLLGNSGDDIYVVRTGDGFDSITEQGGNNTIKLTAGITTDQLALHRTNGNLLLIISGSQTVVVNGMFNASTGDLVANKAIHKIEFSNGEFWDLARVLQESAQGVTLTGGDYNDWLIGYESSDTLIGGKGNDKLRGDKGDDHYHFAIGDGTDQIDDNNGSDHIHLAAGISETQVSLRKDTGNNLIIRINNNDSITVLNAFNATGELTAQAIEQIHFNNTAVWDLARIKTELAKNQSHTFTGTAGSDYLVGDNANQILNGNKGDDQLSGGNASDVYQYALGDGKDVVKDINGIDRLELLAGINESEVVARRSGDDLVLTMKDGGSITLQNTFGGVTAANVVNPAITALIEQLQSHWMSQAEKLIEQHYGLTGSGDIAIGFDENVSGAEAAHVEASYSGPNSTGTDLKLVLDLSDFSNLPNGTAAGYYDRVIAHEMVHAIMARNMNASLLPGWFVEGSAEFIHGADERVKGDASIIGIQSNFNVLFKTTAGSPSTSAGYSVSYIAVKLLDKEIRDKGGVGIKEVFDQLKTGKTLDQSLVAVSAAHSGLATVWNNLSSFETHFKAVGFTQYTQLLALDNMDTGSIAGSDYGHASLNASAVISEAITGPSKHFNLVIPEEYVSTPEMNGVVESIIFNSGGTQWDQARINQEVLKPTNGDDIIHAFDTNDNLSGAKGNDQLFGYGGNDIYRYATGDGSDVIIDSAGTDQIEFSADILAADIRLRRDIENNLVITLKDNSTITVKGAFDTAGNLSAGAIESIKFLSGGIWNGEKIRDEANKSNASIINGTSASEPLIGTDTKDILVGAQGDDNLQGKNGDDSYAYNLGDGKDQITDTAGIDEIAFGDGIVPAEVLLYRQGSYGLKVVLKDGGTILINNMFNSSGEPGTTPIEGMRFSNNDFWDISQIKSKILQDTATSANDEIIGFASNDVIEGGGGFDLLDGKAGNDRYTFRRGDGVDIITDSAGSDTLVFAQGITPDDVMVYQNDGNIYFIINNGEMVQVTGALIDGTPDETKLIERVEFSGGVVWDKTIIQQKITETLANSNINFGRDSWDHLSPIGNGNFLLNGLAGDDQMYGGAGNDTLVGGGGLNFLDGKEGDDTYLITEQPSQNFIEKFRGSSDRILFAEGITSTDVMVRLIPARQESYLNDGVLWVYSFSQAEKWNLELSAGSATIYIDSLFTEGSVNGAKILNPATLTGTVEFFDGTRWTIDDLLVQAVKASSSSDNFVGSGYGEKIEGLQGNDTISALAGNDTVDGGEGNDYLIGGYGMDVLTGGKGNDQLYGDNTNRDYSNSFQAIDDIYRFNQGDGNDTITEFFGHDVIEFGGGIVKENVVFTTVGNDIVVSFINSTDSITIVNGAVPEASFYNGGKIEIFKFANGDTLNFDPKMDPVFREGTTDPDTLVGGFGNDTFIGHQGNDQLKGDLGNDEYRYSLDDGTDYIEEAGGQDKIVFGSSITPDMVQIKKSGYAFDVYVNNVKALSFGYGPWTNANTLEGNPDSLVESLVFSNGDIWDLPMMTAKSLAYTSGDDSLYGTANSDVINGGDGNDLIEAGSGNDLLTGGKGNDLLRGSLGDDIYHFDVADGTDEIFDYGGNDSIEFGVGILPADVTVQRIETDLILKVKNANPITISRFFTNNSSGFLEHSVSSMHAIENIVFANSERWSLTQILEKLPLVGTSAANTIYGFDADNFIDAKEGHDTVYAGGGNDTLVGGIGNDSLHGDAGDDLLQGGDGNDWLNDPYGNNVFVGGKGDDVISLAGSGVIRFALGDGVDTISSILSPIVIELGAGITSDMLAIKSYFLDKSNGSWFNENEGRVDLLISGTSDKINKLLYNGNYTFKFSDNTYWAPEQFSQAVNQSKAFLSSNRQVVTGTARPNSKIYISYLNNNNTVTQHPVIQTDATGYYEFDFGFGIKDLSKITISSEGSSKNTLPITVFGPEIDVSIPPSPTAELDESGYIIKGVARPGTYVSISTDTGHIGSISADKITGAFIIVSWSRLMNGEKIKVVASVSSLVKSEPTILYAQDFTPPSTLIISGGFNNLGTSISGKVEKDATVLVMDRADNILGSAVADAVTGAYLFNFAQPMANGELVKLVVRDAAGNQSVRVINAPDITAPQSIYASIDKTRKIIKGFADPGSTVVVRTTEGVLLRQVVASANDGSFEMTLGTALAANQTVNIKVIDSASNASVAIPLKAGAIDTPAQPSAAFDIQGKIVSGLTGESGVIIVRDKDNVEVNRATVQAGVGFNISLTNAQLNREIFSVVFLSSSGKESAPTYISAPDKTPPSKLVAVMAEYNDKINGYAEPGSTIHITDQENRVIGTATADSTRGDFTVSFNPRLTDGKYVFVTASDSSGNISSALALTAFDLTAPSPPTGSFDAQGLIISGTADAGTQVYVEEINSSSNKQVFATTVADQNGFYSVQLPEAIISGRSVSVISLDSSGRRTYISVLSPDLTQPLPAIAAFDTAGKIITGSVDISVIAGAEVIVMDSTNTIVLGSTIVAAYNLNYEVTLATALKNNEVVNVFVKDLAGNMSYATAINAPDKTAPLQPSANFDVAGKVITGVAEAGSTVIVKNSANTVTLGTVTADLATGVFSVTLATALINKETVNVTAKDVAGNVSIVKAIVAPDKTAPTIPTASFDSAGKVITGVAEAGSTVIVKNAVGTELKTATANATTGAYTITLTTALINKETVIITAKDAAGNISAIKAIVAPDKTAPTAPTATIDTTRKIISGVAEAGSTVAIKNSSGVVLGTITAHATSGAYSITLGTALTVNQIVTVTAKDAAGNISPGKDVVASGSIDTTPPAIPSASFDAAGKIVSGVAEAGSIVVVKNANNTSTLGSVTAHATTGAYSITLVTALINKETVNITATDTTGNVSAPRALVAPDVATPNPASIIIQAENYTSMSGVWNEPTADVGGGQDTGNINTGDWMAYNNIAFSVPAEGRYKVTYRVASLNGGGRLALRELGNESVLGAINIPKTGAWQSWVDVTQEITLSGGTHNFKLYAETGGFNVNWFKLEPLAPLAPDTTPPVQPTAAFDPQGKVISGVAEAGSVVVVKNANNTNTLGTVTADATTGAYSITLVTALINNETVNVTAKDTVGNTSVIKAIVAPDKTAPALPTANFDTAGKVISGVAEAGSVVVVKNAGNTNTLGTVTAHATTGVYSITLVTALINKETVNITATDTAGNVSAARALVAPDVATPNPASVVIQAENYTSMSGVWNEPTADVGGGQDTGNINTGDWMAYNNIAFSVPAEGRYKVTYRVASLNGGGRLALRELGNESVLGAINIPKTGAWQSWVDVTQEITLSGGTHNFKLYAETGGFNVNWFKLEPVAPIALDTRPVQPTAISALINVVAPDTTVPATYDGVHYYHNNDALIQAMASFVSKSGVDTRYRAALFEQSPVVIAVGS